MSSIAPADSLITLRTQIQHAALLAIRDAGKEEHKDSCDIYLQDPQYLKIDEKVCAQFGMTVVNGDIGHQMGYLLIDEDTLVVDWMCSGSVVPLIFEITRPAGLLLAGPLSASLKDMESEVIFSYTLTVHNQGRGQKEEIIYPGLGV